MDDGERITRRAKPSLSVTMPLTMKRWIAAQAMLRGTKQNEIVTELILREMRRVGEADDPARERGELVEAAS